MDPERLKELIQAEIDTIGKMDELGAWENGYICGLEIAKGLIGRAARESQRVFSLGDGLEEKAEYRL